MVKIFINEKDEYNIHSCICKDETSSTCEKYNRNCGICPYAEENMTFINHDSDSIIIETNELDLRFSSCIHKTMYKCGFCGIVDDNSTECVLNCKYNLRNITVNYIDEENK